MGKDVYGEAWDETRGYVPPDSLWQPEEDVSDLATKDARVKGESRHDTAFHLERMNAWMRTLWSANDLSLQMCDSSVRENQRGLLCDIRDDVMALREALSALSDQPAQSGEAVAWRWCQARKGRAYPWVYIETRPDWLGNSDRFIVEPLYLHPSPAPITAEQLAREMADALGWKWDGLVDQHSVPITTRGYWLDRARFALSRLNGEKSS